MILTFQHVEFSSKVPIEEIDVKDPPPSMTIPNVKRLFDDVSSPKLEFRIESIETVEATEGNEDGDTKRPRLDTEVSEPQSGPSGLNRRNDVAEPEEEEELDLQFEPPPGPSTRNGAGNGGLFGTSGSPGRHFYSPNSPPYPGQERQEHFPRRRSTIVKVSNVRPRRGNVSDCVRGLFIGFDDILYVTVVDANTALVQFARENSARAAIDGYNGTPLNGANINVAYHFQAF